MGKNVDENPGVALEKHYRGVRDKTLMRVFILPTLILLIAINVFPLIWSLFLSFTDYSAKMANVWGKNPAWVSSQNFADVLTNPEMWEKFITTAKYVIMTVAGEMILGFGLALLLQLDFKGRGLITTLLVLPMTMSPVIVGLMWKLFYDPNWGMFNFLLGLGRVDWIQDPARNLYSIVIADIWMWTPFVMLLSLAGLGAVPKYLYEAAEIDRASWWFKFTRITLPMVSPILMLALIFRIIEAFKIFDLPMGITGRGAMAPPLLAMHLYNVSFVTWKTSYGSAIGYIMLIMVLAITLVLVKYLNRAKQ
ncbi:MAG: sugar ABC transporter permease [Spirochaetes bacterium]|nr:sugar ABC transporter permease [Spirochaetota bacterium]